MPAKDLAFIQQNNYMEGSNSHACRAVSRGRQSVEHQLRRLTLRSSQTTFHPL